MFHKQRLPAIEVRFKFEVDVSSTDEAMEADQIFSGYEQPDPSPGFAMVHVLSTDYDR